MNWSDYIFGFLVIVFVLLFGAGVTQERWQRKQWRAEFKEWKRRNGR